MVRKSNRPALGFVVFGDSIRDPTGKGKPARSQSCQSCLCFISASQVARSTGVDDVTPTRRDSVGDSKAASPRTETEQRGRGGLVIIEEENKPVLLVPRFPLHRSPAFPSSLLTPLLFLCRRIGSATAPWRVASRLPQSTLMTDPRHSSLTDKKQEQSRLRPMRVLQSDSLFFCVSAFVLCIVFPVPVNVVSRIVAATCSRNE